MKPKDIEKYLKKESESANVPDVLSRVRHAPINRLLTGETPVQAFKKTIATRLLFFTFVLFLVITVCSVALLFSNGNPSPVKRMYVSVSVQNEQGLTRMGFVVSSQGRVQLAVLENEQNEPHHEYLDKTIENAVSQFYQPKTGDEVYVRVTCADSNTAIGYVDVLKELLLADSSKVANVIVRGSANSQSERTILVDAIKQKLPDQQVGAGTDTETLISLYLQSQGK